MNSAQDTIIRFLREMGCRQSAIKTIFILDGFDSECYLIFDATEDPETPDSVGTCDILIAKPGSHPQDSETKIRVLANCRRYHMLRFMIAFGLDRLSKKTRQFLHKANGTIKTAEML